MMEITEAREGQTFILALSGRLDTLHAPTMSDRAIALCNTGIGSLLIDLTQVEYLSSAGFRAFAQIKRCSDQGHIGMALCGLNEMVSHLFEITGMREIFRIYASRSGALAALGTPGPA